MARFGIDFTTDLADRLATWQEQFVSETSWYEYERACAWVVDTVAKRVSLGMRRAGAEILDRPMPWTLQGFAYRRAMSKSRHYSDGFFSEFYVQDDQSIVLKYHLGVGNNIRYPGDVGLAQDRIWIPAWDNLAKSQGLKPNQYGNLQGGIMSRFVRESQGDASKRRSNPNSGGIFKTTQVISGVETDVYKSRPRRVRDDDAMPKRGRSVLVMGPNGGYRQVFERSNGSEARVPPMRNEGTPKVLMYSIAKANYKPTLQKAWDREVYDAVDAIPDLMASELARNLAHAARQV